MKRVQNQLRTRQRMAALGFDSSWINRIAGQWWFATLVLRAGFRISNSHILRLTPAVLVSKTIIIHHSHTTQPLNSNHYHTLIFPPFVLFCGSFLLCSCHRALSDAAAWQSWDQDIHDVWPTQPVALGSVTSQSSGPPFNFMFFQICYERMPWIALLDPTWLQPIVWHTWLLHSIPLHDVFTLQRSCIQA